METISEKIKKLEQELTALRQQEQTEKEEAKRKAEEAKANDLKAIQDAVAEYNKKYGSNIGIYLGKATDIDDWFNTHFPWFGD